MQEILSFPSKIDILTILGYNERIAGRDDKEFMDVICTLDDMYLDNWRSKKGA